jgi:VanZ family protein
MSPVERDEPAALTGLPPRPVGAIDEEERARTTGRNRRLAWRVLANLVTLAILVACFLPDPGLPPGDDFPWDKVAHALAFGAFAFCWRLAGLGPLLVVLAGALLTAATEIGQAVFLPQRAAEWGDVAADLAGVALGLWLGRLTVARRLKSELAACAARRTSPSRS